VLRDYGCIISTGDGYISIKAILTISYHMQVI